MHLKDELVLLDVFGAADHADYDNDQQWQEQRYAEGDHKDVLHQCDDRADTPRDLIVSCDVREE